MALRHKKYDVQGAVSPRKCAYARWGTDHSKLVGIMKKILNYLFEHKKPFREQAERSIAQYLPAGIQRDGDRRVHHCIPDAEYQHR